MNCETSRIVGEDRPAIIINGEEEVACGREGNAADVLTVRERQSVGLVTVKYVNECLLLDMQIILLLD